MSTATLLNGADMSLCVEVAEAYARQRETQLRIAQRLTAGRTGILADTIASHPHWQNVLCAYFLETPTGEAREAALRATVKREHSAEIREAIETRMSRVDRAICSGPAERAILRKEAERECQALEADMHAALEPEITERLGRGAARWEFDGITDMGVGRWKDATSDATLETPPVSFSIQLQLGELDPDAVRGGLAMTIVLTDLEEVTEAEQARVERGRNCRLMRLGEGYRTELQKRLDALRSPLATLPEI